MKSISASIAAALVAAGVASARTVTVRNACSFTIWPAVFTAASTNNTGWEAPAGSSKSITVPNNWNSGFIWGRRNCNFSSTLPGEQQCATGGCPGGLSCTGSATSPVTLTEFHLDSNSVDFVDISLASGFNLPVKITNNQGCPQQTCSADLNAACPAPLRGPTDASGAVLGCNSACSANLDGTPQDSANCCTGTHVAPANCPARGVQYYSYFKNGCPDAYAFAYDEPAHSLTCSASKLADYTVTFCP